MADFGILGGMRTFLRLGALCLALSTTSCATIVGTAFSPITGGVDLVKRTQRLDDWPLWFPTFVGGAIAGPFVAVYNGINHDASLPKSWWRYWNGFDQVFRPFEMIGVPSVNE